MKIEQMTSNQRQDIQHLLKKYVGTFPSQSRAAASLDNCSEASVINILKGGEAWKNVSESMWLNVGKQVGAFKQKSKMVETADFSTLILYYSLAKEEGATFYIIGGAGYGKTYTAEWYAEANRSREVFYIECAMYWSKKQFLSSLIHALGKSSDGLSISEMMELIVRTLSRKHQPLFLIDECDKLSDNVLAFFITLYNKLDSLCGFVMQSTNHMQKRMMKGLRANKTGYQEFYSRIGSKFIELTGTTPHEVREMCIENGITKEEDIRSVINDYKGDLRRVRRHLLKHTAKRINEHKKRVA